MGYQPEGKVTRLPRERIAGEALPFYRIIKEGTGANAGKYFLCDAGEVPVGLTIASEDGYRWDNTNKAMVKRTNYPINEYPEGIIEGIGYVELAETVSPGQICVAAADGKGAGNDSQLTALTAGELAVGIGRFIDGGDAGDFVRVKLSI